MQFGRNAESQMQPMCSSLREKPARTNAKAKSSVLDEGVLMTRFVEPDAQLPPTTPSQEVIMDYPSTDLTLHEHPLALPRATLRSCKVSSAEQLEPIGNGRIGNGRIVKVAGLVLSRQQPKTAKTP